MEGKRQLGTGIKRLNGTMHDPMSYQITRVGDPVASWTATSVRQEMQD
jgi:hypothetical protein